MPRKPIFGATIVFSLCFASPAAAHGGRVPFAEWGPFASTALQCQRGISRAAATCARDSWELTRACRDGQGRGTPCDTTALNARLQAVRLAALDAADAACSERQAQDLGYLGLFDLQGDLIDFCRAWNTAAATGVYGPIPQAQEDNACPQALADSTSRLLAFVFRGRRRCMETIAAKPVDAAARESLLSRTADSVDRYTSGLAAAVELECPAARFTALYGRPASELLSTLATRAECLAATVYIQDRLICAPAVCGNGVVEPGEFCDDGNLVGGDACSPDCAE